MEYILERIFDPKSIFLTYFFLTRNIIRKLLNIVWNQKPKRSIDMIVGNCRPHNNVTGIQISNECFLAYTWTHTSVKYSFNKQTYQPINRPTIYPAIIRLFMQLQFNGFNDIYHPCNGYKISVKTLYNNKGKHTQNILQHQ